MSEPVAWIVTVHASQHSEEYSFVEMDEVIARSNTSSRKVTITPLYAHPLPAGPEEAVRAIARMRQAITTAISAHVSTRRGRIYGIGEAADAIIALRPPSPPEGDTRSLATRAENAPVEADAVRALVEACRPFANIGEWLKASPWKWPGPGRTAKTYTGAPKLSEPGDVPEPPGENDFISIATALSALTGEQA